MGRYSALSPEDLVRDCIQVGAVEAWEEFVRRFQPVIARVAHRTAQRWTNPSGSLIDDLVQETYLKLCEDDRRLLKQFQPRHPASIFGFLKAVTASVVTDHFRARHAAKRGAGKDGLSLEAAERADGGSMEGLERQLLLTQLARHLEQCLTGPDQRRNSVVFWLYYRQGLTAAQIAAIPALGLSTKGVESTILRLTRLMRARLARSGVSEPPPGP